MTDEEHKYLSDRLFATSGFAFIGGMLELTSSERILSVNELEMTFGCLESFSTGWQLDHCLETTPIYSYYRPDLRDPATIGCLIALLEKVAEGWVSVSWSEHKGFRVIRIDHFDEHLPSVTVTKPTLAEALVELFERYDTNKKDTAHGS